MQDWEQPPPSHRPTLSDTLLVDDPSPPVIPLYLRGPPKQAATVEPAFDARTQTLTAQTAALVDSLTRGLAEALMEAMRPVVAASVRQLLPMLLSLGSIPDDEAGPDLSPEPAAAGAT